MKRYASLSAWRDAQNKTDGGLSQRAAAKRFGISQPYWSLLEKGERCPRPKLAQRLATETGVPLEVLLGIAS